MKLLLKKLALSLSLVLVALLVSHCNSSSTLQSGLEVPEDPNIVAKINDYVITKGELENKLSKWKNMHSIAEDVLVCHTI